MADRHAMSPEMARVLAKAEEVGGTLIRLPGGYWTCEGAKWNGSAPEWYAATPTIEALVRRKELEYVEWRNGRAGEFPIKVRIPPPPPSPSPQGEKG